MRWSVLVDHGSSVAALRPSVWLDTESLQQSWCFSPPQRVCYKTSANQSYCQNALHNKKRSPRLYGVCFRCITVAVIPFAHQNCDLWTPYAVLCSKQEAGTPFFFQMNINGNCSGLLLSSMIIHVSTHDVVQTEERIRNTECKTAFWKGSTGTSGPERSSCTLALLRPISQDSPYSTTIFIMKK